MPTGIRPASTLALAIALVAVMATVPMAAVAPPPTPMVAIDITINPQGVLIYPTEDWNLNLAFAGDVVVSKLRPDPLIVNLEYSMTTDWMGLVTPQTIDVRQMGTTQHHFDASVFVPDHTVGPPSVTFTVRAVATLSGRTVEDSVDVTITILPIEEGFVTGVTPVITIYHGTRDLFGRMSLNNHQDQAIDVGISTSGKWERLVPDLRFIEPVHLEPSATEKVGFQGTLAEDLDIGRYDFPIELWTTSQGGHRIVITRTNVTISVVDQQESDLFIKARIVLLFMVIIVTPISAVVLFWLWRNRARWVEPWQPNQLRRWLGRDRGPRRPRALRGRAVR